MTTTDDAAQLELRAQAATERAAKARQDADAATARKATERAEREQEWRRAFLARYNRAKVDAEVTTARQALADALATDPLGKALIDYLTAERVRDDLVSFAESASALAGVGSYTGMPPQRVISDPAELLATLAADAASQQAAQVAADRHASFETYSTDHGRLDVDSVPISVTLCGACQRPLDATTAYRREDGIAFHPDAPCRPRLKYTAEQLGESRAAERRADKTNQSWFG